MRQRSPGLNLDRLLGPRGSRIGPDTLTPTPHANALRVYHGSDRKGLKRLNPNAPNLRHGGDLGHGVYVSPNEDVAHRYGRHIYALDLFVAPDDILELTSESEGVDFVEGLEGTSILVGERLPPFRFVMPKTGQGYYVGGDDAMEQAVLEEVRQMLTRREANLGVLISGEIERLDRVPDLDDEEAIDRVFQEFWDQHKRDPEGPEVARLEARGRALRQQLVAAVEEIEKRHEGLSIDLSDIAQEAKSAGYRAVHMAGIRQGDELDEEILDLYEEDLVMRGEVQ